MTHCLLRGLTWAVLRAWTQNYPKVVGTCPGHHPHAIGQNRVFKFKMRIFSGGFGILKNFKKEKKTGRKKRKRASQFKRDNLCLVSGDDMSYS